MAASYSIPHRNAQLPFSFWLEKSLKEEEYVQVKYGFPEM